MGGGFSMPSDKIESEHIITRYRSLMYIKQHQGGFRINSDFDEKDYICMDGYGAIPLEDGRQIHVQGAKYGIWYLSPTIWHDIIDNGDCMCLCTGNKKDDFLFIASADDMHAVVKRSKRAYIAMAPNDNNTLMDSIASVFGAGTKTKGDVHLMLKLHQTPDPTLNSMFDEAFENQGTMYI